MKDIYSMDSLNRSVIFKNNDMMYSIRLVDSSISEVEFIIRKALFFRAHKLSLLLYLLPIIYIK